MRLKLLDILLLGVGAAFVPLGVMARNPLEIGHPERIIGLVVLLWAVAVSLVAILIKRGVRRSTAVYSTFVATVIVMRGGRLLSVLGPPLGWMVSITLVLIAAALLSRSESHRLYRILFLSGGFALASGPVLTLNSSLAEIGTNTAVAVELDRLALSAHPDFFVVILDGYLGLRGLQNDFGVARPTVVTELEGRGFVVPRSAWSSYSSTATAVPSVLDMSYPVLAGDGLSPATNRYLAGMTGGSNAFLSILESEGYESVMIESGWSGSACGREIDHCVPAPLLDEAMFLVLANTIVGPSILQSLGYSFTVGSQETMSWLLESGPSWSVDGQPTLVFAHIAAPHPPFFLDGECETAYSAERSGVIFRRPGDDLHQRREWYLEQMSCIDAFMIELADSLDPETVVVFVADHGTDQRGQLARHPNTWQIEDLAERFNIFLAVRSGPSCVISDGVVGPNVLRQLLSCLSDQPLPDLEPRMFKYAGITFEGSLSPVVEVEERDVRELLRS